MNRPDWQTRVIEEQAQLHDRLTKLNAFIGLPSFSDLEPFDQKLLRAQQQAMTDYDAVLVHRIAGFH